MLVGTAQTVVSYVVNVSLLSVFISVLVGAVFIAAKIPARVARHKFEKYFDGIRRRHYYERDMYPSAGTLRRELRRCSNELFAVFTRAPTDTGKSGMPFWFSIEPWPFDIPTGSAGTLRRVFPDLELPELEKIAGELRSLAVPVRKRLAFLTHSVTFVAASIVAHGWQLDSLAALRGLGVDTSRIGVPDAWQPIRSYYLDGTVQWTGLVGIWISAVVLTLASAWMVRRVYVHGFGIGEEAEEEASVEADETPAPDDDVAPLGEEKCAVRALSFAGGAFDTIMQIGVAHALLTIQGRAPDAVVGISGGSVNAVALAEIFQEGEAHEKQAIRAALGLDADPEITAANVGALWRKLGTAEQQTIHRQRRAARVNKLRECIEAAQQAPRQLFDALLPDPYQIDTTKPLRPLEQPRFAPEERDARADAAIRRTGLVRLYNHILNIPFSIGILVRAVRRYLGIKAACEIRHVPTRMAMWILEGVRLWVLLGVNLIYASPLLRVLLESFRTRRETAGATAGNLIFRFRLMSRVVTYAKNTVAFVVLLATWVSITLFFFSLGHLLAWVPIIGEHRWTFTFGLYALLIVPSLITGGGLTQAERSTVTELLAGAAKTISILLLLTAGWTSVLFVGPLLPDMILNGWYLPWPLIDWDSHYGAVAALLLLPIAAVAILVWNAMTHELSFGDRFLRSYNLNDSILRVHGLRSFFIELFDKHFYRNPAMDDVVEESLRDEIRFNRPRPGQEPKLIARYSAKARLEPVHVGVAVANTSTGTLDVVGRDKPVVDALVAGLSATPLFRAVELDDELFINGSNVANEPTRALLGYLRRYLNKDPGPVHVYTVSPFPMSEAALGKPALVPSDDDDVSDEGASRRALPKPVLNLVDVTLRAIRLQRYRDATLERRLTELISRSIRPGDNHLELPVTVDGQPETQRFLRAWIAAIELDTPKSTNAALIGASKDARRKLILRTVADGCRASMQVMLGDAIKTTASNGTGRPGGVGVAVNIDDDVTEWIAPCARVVESHIKSRPNGETWSGQPLPGSRPDCGPGLAEVCSHCRIWRDKVPEAKLADEDKTPGSKVRAAGSNLGAKGERPSVDLQDHNAACLRQRSWWKVRGPAWPHEREYVPDRPDEKLHFVRARSKFKDTTESALRAIGDERRPVRLKPFDGTPGKSEPAWPLQRTAIEQVDGTLRRERLSGNERATVSFLFSGGVFRGVYQMGVLTALDQLNLKPDVIAGASVGSITAAMVAETFSIKERRRRHARIAQLAAVYLAIDRIILTDRFADFVRDLTLRAADTQFSIRQADRLFRKYDHPALLEFDRNARDVIAGIERLLYINPYQLNEFTKSVRNKDYGAVLAQLREFGQQVLDRMFVGDEVLGAEALEALIEAYVTGDRQGVNPVGLQFDDLRQQAGIQFLATTTNLAQGRLEILGEKPGESSDGQYLSPILCEGLLASSAFPGVFRPRWSWELYPDTEVTDQYIDGGVMDNLPVDAVAQFLYRAYRAGLIRSQPEKGPHLVVAASLQVNARRFATSKARRAYQESWLSLRKRAKELKYNTKIDIYRETQRALRRIGQHYRENGTVRGSAEKWDELEILDLEVVPIKPNRLCSTFAFHPMLGFKQKSQKESIAHGCASTLLKFGQYRAGDADASYLDTWRIRLKSVPKTDSWPVAFENLANKDELKKKGLCWLTARPCPFSAQSLSKFGKRGADSDPALAATTIEEVATIHHVCMEPQTHLRPV